MCFRANASNYRRQVSRARGLDFGRMFRRAGERIGGRASTLPLRLRERLIAMAVAELDRCIANTAMISPRITAWLDRASRAP